LFTERINSWIVVVGYPEIGPHGMFLSEIPDGSESIPGPRPRGTATGDRNRAEAEEPDCVPIGDFFRGCQAQASCWLSVSMTI
jgi:hypothetical protein